MTQRALRYLKGFFLEQGGIVILFLLGLFLRMYRIGEKSLWYDEALLLLQAKKPFLNLFSLNSEGVHPPLYRLLMHFWVQLGSGEAWLRMPSAVLSALSVILSYQIARLIFDKRTGLYTAFLVGISPFQVYYAQEAKMYALFFFLSLYSVLLFLRAIESGRPISWFLYIAASVLSFNTNYFTALSLATQAIFMFFHRARYRKAMPAWAMSQALILFLLLPLASSFLIQVARVRQGFWISRFSPAGMLDVFRNFTVGYYSVYFGTFLPRALLFVVLLCCLIVLAKEGTGGEGRGNAYRDLAWLYLLAPPAMALVFSVLVRPVFIDRFLIVVSFFYYLALGKVIDISRRKKALFIPLVLSVAALSGLSLLSLYQGRDFRASEGVIGKERPFREAAAYLAGHHSGNERIVLSHYSLWPPFAYYFPERLRGRIYLERTPLFDNYNDRYCFTSLQQSLDLRMIDIEKAARRKEGVWIICASWEETPFISARMRQWMGAHDKDLALRTDTFRGLKIYYFLNAGE